MSHLLPLVIGLGLADSLNPITIAVGIFIATTERPAWRLAGYIAGIFVLYLGGGLLLLFGPGFLLRTATEGLSPTVNSIVALTIGVGAFVAAAIGWRHRHRVTNREIPEKALHPRSMVALGAGMTAVDLPTAFPYFAVIAGIVKRDPSTPVAIAAMVIFNLCYILPLVAILVARVVAGERIEPFLGRLRDRVFAWAPAILAVITVAAGAYFTYLGISGLVTG
ncbi:MAG: GAP family protein [Solirubrobacteraceae bacterium]